MKTSILLVFLTAAILLAAFAEGEKGNGRSATVALASGGGDGKGTANLFDLHFFDRLPQKVHYAPPDQFGVTRGNSGHNFSANLRVRDEFRRLALWRAATVSLR